MYKTIPHILIFFLSSTAFAGVLDDFESDATKKRKHESAESSYQNCDREDECKNESFFGTLFGEMLGGMFNVLIEGVFVEGTKTTLDRVSTYKKNKEILTRKPGSPLLPNVRVDANKLTVSNGITGEDIRIEGGHSLFGAQLRFTNYRESDPVDSMKLASFHALYRLSYGNRAGMNIGLGFSNLSGNESTSGFSFTSPIFLHFNHRVGVEYRPAFSNLNGTAIFDNDVSVMFHHDQASISIGYRNLSSPNNELPGFYVGFSFRN